MKYINSSFEEIIIDEKLCLTIGNFDGIHKGHREIIKNLIQKTKISKYKSAILSFTPHPKIYFKKQKKASHKCGRVMGNLIFKPNS